MHSAELKNSPVIAEQYEVPAAVDSLPAATPLDITSLQQHVQWHSITCPNDTRVDELSARGNNIDVNFFQQQEQLANDLKHAQDFGIFTNMQSPDEMLLNYIQAQVEQFDSPSSTPIPYNLLLLKEYLVKRVYTKKNRCLSSSKTQTCTPLSELFPNVQQSKMHHQKDDNCPDLLQHQVEPHIGSASNLPMVSVNGGSTMLPVVRITRSPPSTANQSLSTQEEEMINMRKRGRDTVSQDNVDDNNMDFVPENQVEDFVTSEKLQQRNMTRKMRRKST